MKKTAILAMAAALAASAWAVQGTVKSETDSKTGDIKWQPRSKSYLVSFKKGATAVSSEFPLDSVVKIDVEKPANFDKLVDLVSKGQGQSAVEGLKAIVATYKMIVWDKPAARWLVQAYLDAGKAQQAYDTAQDLIKDDKTAAYAGELAPAYWQALLKLGKKQPLENCLRLAASSDDRAASAEALAMRGDIIVADGGDSPDSYRKALVDAYLRVALMYTDPACREARRGAMLKCAMCFDKLGMGVRAERMKASAKEL
jgi:hypothetical protein